jgi:hypothetical protein
VVNNQQRILTVLWLVVKTRIAASLDLLTSPRKYPRLRSDSGMATLETALMIPVLFLITFLFISGIALGVQTLSLSDATRTAARELARGTSEELVREGFYLSEPTAQLQIIWDTDTVSILTRKPGEFGVSFLGLTPFEISQTHVAPREWINAQ